MTSKSAQQFPSWSRKLRSMRMPYRLRPQRDQIFDTTPSFFLLQSRDLDEVVVLQLLQNKVAHRLPRPQSLQRTRARRKYSRTRTQDRLGRLHTLLRPVCSDSGIVRTCLAPLLRYVRAVYVSRDLLAEVTYFEVRPKTFWKNTRRSALTGPSYSPASYIVRRSTFIAAGLKLDTPHADLSALGVELRVTGVVLVPSSEFPL